MSRSVLYITLPISLAIVIAGGLMARAGNPDSVVGTQQRVVMAQPNAAACCGPRPEDIRFYRFEVVYENGETTTTPKVIIPEVEAAGLVITDIIARNVSNGNDWTLYVDAGQGPEPIFFIGRLDPFEDLWSPPHHFSSGIPIAGGASILAGRAVITQTENTIELFVSGYVLPVESCAADLDGSGAVDSLDLANLLGSWGPCS